MNGRTAGRILVGVVALGLVLALAAGFVTAGESPNQRYEESAQLPANEREQVVGQRGGVTVVTVQKGGMRDLSGEIVAFAPNGTVLYHGDRYSSYWDVDPNDRGRRTVDFVATTWLNESVCGGGPLLADRGDCRRNVVVRLNLSTGERTTLYAHRMEGGRWHDVDVVNDTHLLVADIGNEAVFLVNTSSGIREWTWTAESELPITGGGSYDKDWVHLNDVELLADGRIMVSLRNQDQVAFLNRSGGIVENWTLGSEDDYATLREQHNPDYVPKSEGGPAVVVADSENDRVVEYQRRNDEQGTGGEWQRTWVWTDEEMQWPRDADRLPNGHTLITDTIGDRLVEVNEAGEIVWRAPIDRAYEAERLAPSAKSGGGGESGGIENGGAESAGGPSAVKANLESRRPPSATGPADEDTVQRLADRFESAVRSATPQVVENGLLGYFFPWWMGFYDVTAALLLAVVVVGWGALELWWSSVSLRSGGSVASRGSGDSAMSVRSPGSARSLGPVASFVGSLTSLRSILLLAALAVLALLGYGATVVASLV